MPLYIPACKHLELRVDEATEAAIHEFAKQDLPSVSQVEAHFDELIGGLYFAHCKKKKAACVVMAATGVQNPDGKVPLRVLAGSTYSMDSCRSKRPKNEVETLYRFIAAHVVYAPQGPK